MTPDLPDVFLLYQQELWATVDANRLTVAEKSRRTGFTWALAAIAAGEASKARSAGGQDVLYMAYEKEITREFINYVAMWAKFFQYAASDVEESVFIDPDHPDREIAVFRIRFASGFEVIALPSVARRLRGHQGLVILDEAAFMDNLAAILKAAYALLIWGREERSQSPNSGEHARVSYRSGIPAITVARHSAMSRRIRGNMLRAVRSRRRPPREQGSKARTRPPN